MHWYELLPLALLALLFFGPKRLPEMGASIGKTIRNFQQSMREVTGSFDAPAETAPKPVAPATPASLPAPVEAEATPAAVVEAEPAAEPVSAQAGADA